MNVDFLTAEFLSEITGHALAGFTLSAQEAVTAQAAWITLDYGGTPPADAPARLFLKKMVARPAEVRFYQHVAPHMPEAPIPHCYYAQYDEEKDEGYTILEDLADTHRDLGEGEAAPAGDQLRMVDGALYAIHRHWWQHPDLSGRLAAVCEDFFSMIHRESVASYAAFADAAGERLSPYMRSLYEKLLAAWPYPAYAERWPAAPKTVVHGDTHFYNMLLPKDPARHQVVWIDWAVWHIDTAASDLAYQVLLESPDWQRANEAALLGETNTRLLHDGVSGYPWDQFLLDYRLAVLAHMLWFPFWFAHGLPEEIQQRTLPAASYAAERMQLADLLP